MISERREHLLNVEYNTNKNEVLKESVNISLKETNKTPITNPEEIEIYELTKNSEYFL